jgi:hypothetical protein
MITSPSTKIFSTSTLLTVQQEACAHELCKVRARVHMFWPYIDRMYLSNSEAYERPSNLAQEETTGTENQGLLKT